MVRKSERHPNTQGTAFERDLKLLLEKGDSLDAVLVNIIGKDLEGEKLTQAVKDKDKYKYKDKDNTKYEDNGRRPTSRTPQETRERERGGKNEHRCGYRKSSLK